MKSCGIIGTGKLGTTLSEALDRLGRLSWVISRSEESVTRVSGRISAKVEILSDIRKIDKIPGIIFITTKDSEIEEVADNLADQFHENLDGIIIVHCSGILGLNVLNKCNIEGAITVGAHPYQTFFAMKSEDLNGIAWGIEAKNDVEDLNYLIKELNGKPVLLADETIKLKALYHCSAVVASNFLTALLHNSIKIAETAEIQPMDFIKPIVETTIKNVWDNLEQNHKLSLTGPYARGDVGAISLHLNALKAYPQILEIYVNLAKATSQSAYDSGILNFDNYSKIMNLLNES
jgi:predicted short-subunit dehydrogenase-like oxidoreductase (DUF2520 family)